MGEMREIVTAEGATRLFVMLALVSPIVGGLLGLTARRMTVSLAKRNRLLAALLVGLLGPLNFALWTLYNALTNHNGLDTVRNVVINATVFVVIGASVGGTIGWLQKRAIPPPPRTEPPQSD